MIRLKAPHALLSTLIITGLVAGCTNTPAETRHALNIVDSPIALNQEQPEWKEPFWESDGDNNEADQETAPSFVKRNEPLGNVGLRVDAAVADALPRALRQQASQYGLLILPPNLLSEAIAHGQGCDQPTSKACLSSLAVYPGIRLLVRIEPAGQGQVRVQVRDTRLGKSWQQQIPAGADSARTLLTSLASQAATAPWSAQAFSGGDGNLYISTGRVNGLAEGTTLAVREPGQPVRTPAGQVIAWHYGDIVGTATVRQWVGATLSQVVPKSGVAPGPDYRLTLMPKTPEAGEE